MLTYKAVITIMRFKQLYIINKEKSSKPCLIKGLILTCKAAATVMPFKELDSK